MKKLWILLPAIWVFIISFIIPFTFWPEMLDWPFFVNNGWLPYRDIIIVHTPLLFSILSYWYNFFGENLQALHLFGSLLLFLSVLLVSFLSVWLTKNSFVGFIAGAVFGFLSLAFNGNHVWFESLVLPFLLISFYYQLKFFEVKKNKYLFISGLFFGGAILTKQTTAYLLPIILILYSRSRRLKSLLIFLIPISLLIAISLIWLNTIGVLPEFYDWAVKFVFLKPFLGRHENGFLLLPNIRQLTILAVFPLTAVISLWQTRKFPVFYAFVWASLSTLFAFPRFDYFHLIPALAFFVIGISASNAFKLLVPVILFIGFLIFSKNITYTHTFIEPEIEKIVNNIETNYQTKTLFVLNGPDQIYFLLQKMPAVKPWLPQLPWYFAYYKDSRFLHDLQSSKPDLILYLPYRQTPVNGLGAYQPDGIIAYLNKNYRLAKTFPNGLLLMEKI